MNPLTKRELLIITGLYLSKFDQSGLARLGFKSFTEAFNAIALALKAKPASLKNYRDEFDPLFPNPRQGWHKRPLRRHCEEAYSRYGHLDLDAFVNTLGTLLDEAQIRNAVENDVMDQADDDADSTFARRLITGAAAEGYFEEVFPNLGLFSGHRLENATRLGCGFDFKVSAPDTPDFYAVEVKGLRAATGNVALTQKEHRVAARLGVRYFLFVARNFADEPFHSLYHDPLNCDLQFVEKRRTVEVVTWNLRLMDL